MRKKSLRKPPVADPLHSFLNGLPHGTTVREARSFTSQPPTASTFDTLRHRLTRPQSRATLHQSTPSRSLTSRDGWDVAPLDAPEGEQVAGYGYAPCVFRVELRRARENTTPSLWPAPASLSPAETCSSAGEGHTVEPETCWRLPDA